MIKPLAPTDLLNVTLRWADNDIQTVGRLGYVNRVAHFEYADDIRSSNIEISPVRHRFSVGSATIRPFDVALFEGLHGVFHDSLPDSWGRLLTDRRARELGIEPATLTPLDRLAWVGDRGIGALCYEPGVNVWNEKQSALDLDLLASDARNVLEGNVSDVVAELGHLGGSPGGARPKAMVAIDADDGAIYGSAEFDPKYQHCLVKFRGTDDPTDAANIEKAYANMAEAAGVRVPVTRLIADYKGNQYFVSQRFDRVGKKRLHAHSASGLLYADFRLPSLDYRDLITLTRAITHDRREVSAMFALAVFNVLAHNRDDHARQFTFLMTRNGQWQLAPAYDLTFSPGPGGEHSTSVLGRGKQITNSHLMALGKSADLDDTESKRIIERTAAAVADWERFARNCDVGRASRSRIGSALASSQKI
ncbi:MAG: type II toxin-antitoxin system HipA family toxin [Pseudomonadales bacterium]|nr:type II toxin-antitoxin system HipA family toxin [Pseudomonadales bacterium]